jgi:hypothetical protein
MREGAQMINHKVRNGDCAVDSVLRQLQEELETKIHRAAQKIGKPVSGKNSCIYAFLTGFNPSDREEMLTGLKPEVLIGYAAILQRYISVGIGLPENENNNLKVHLGMVAIANYVLGAAEAVIGKEAISSLLRSAWARKRHEETYALQEEVVTYWRKNIDPKKSNEKAATELEKVFPISHRKLSEYVAKAKKDLLSSSSA